MCSSARTPSLIGIAALLALVAQTALGQEAADEAPSGKKVELPDTWYAQAVARSDRALNVTHFWSKGDMLRAETVIAGRRVVTIVNGDTYYAYDAVLRNGVAIQRSRIAVQQDEERDRPFGNDLATILRQGAEKVREEKLGGGMAELYQVTNKRGRTRVWVTQTDPPLPMRIEMFRRATASDVATDYLSWQRGLPVADDFFLPETGIEMQLMTLAEYVSGQAERRPAGPVPVLYGDLLHGY